MEAKIEFIKGWFGHGTINLKSKSIKIDMYCILFDDSVSLNKKFKSCSNSVNFVSILWISVMKTALGIYDRELERKNLPRIMTKKLGNWKSRINKKLLLLSKC